jgi:hypothetical protein
MMGERKGIENISRYESSIGFIAIDVNNLARWLIDVLQS